jgi:hypothetical protein
MEKQIVYSFANGTWYFQDEIANIDWYSDHEVLTFPGFVSDDEIDEICNLRNFQLIVGILNKIDDNEIFDIFSIRKLNNVIYQLQDDKKLWGSITDQISSIFNFIFPSFE